MRKAHQGSGTFVFERRTMRYASRDWGMVRRGRVMIHHESICSGHCAFHTPSKHHMRKWPTVLRFDRNLMVERTCPHGIGHPDPDWLAYHETTVALDEDSYAGVHGCDGCCSRRKDVPG